jgi:hypothetical protein
LATAVEVVVRVVLVALVLSGSVVVVDCVSVVDSAALSRGALSF